jgi:hypothetical protein
MTNNGGRRLVTGALLAAVAIAACSTPVVTPSVGPVGSPTPTSTPAPPATIPATIAPTEPAPSLAAISPTDIGPGPWTLIATATNTGSGGPEVGILGGVRSNVAYIFTCAGKGTAKVSLGASTKAMGDENPPASPVPAGSGTYECPGTEILTDDTGMYAGGGWFISPDVDASAGVIYQLLVVTDGG